MIESDIEQYLCARIKSIGGDVRKVKWLDRRGAPDRFCLTKSRNVWVELKRPGGVAEDHQMREHKRLRAYGEEVFVINSLAGVDHLIDSLARLKLRV